VLSADVQVDGVLAAVAYGSSASDSTQDLLGKAAAPVQPSVTARCEPQ
tara:strand:- start:1634 stop:1777 length:144 start_codon:yes stop_codon:yes gene_type:complete